MRPRQIAHGTLRPSLRAGIPVVIATLVLVLPGIAAPPGSSARNITKCVSASRLLQGTRGGMIHAALRLTPHFQIRVAGHARPGDLNYDVLAATCTRAIIRRTWYIDLHPPGIQCNACDSHEYWVRLRRSGWATLGYFGG